MARILAPYRTFEASVDGVASPTALGAVHACSCWTPATCRWLVAAADAFGGWGTERHASVPTTDLEVLKVDALRDWLLCESRETLFPTLAHLYGFEPSELHFMDLFLVRYTAEQGEGGQRGLRSHRDRSLLSFNLLLSDPGAFDGGGTRIHALDGQTVHPRAQGDLVAHSGKLLHTGMPVTRGTREILVGFVGVNSPNVDQPFLRSLFAKLNIEGTARDFEILRRAMRTQPKGDKHASEPAADTRVADTGVADTGAVDSGVADAGFADTGAADTGAADIGAADTRAADTGSADSGALGEVARVRVPVSPGVSARRVPPLGTRCVLAFHDFGEEVDDELALLAAARSDLQASRPKYTCCYTPPAEPTEKEEEKKIHLQDLAVFFEAGWYLCSSYN
ncbi:hypothetical protein T492DRAFT_849184 [Pavlovales sp. CCMP2436]|nr:hypothetical protein T492DRAFT_849184 [Pavlovales sp. CCMP2436]